MERKEILEQIEQLKKKIEELQGRFIDFELPKNYDKMSKEEQKAYHKEQKKLKQEALREMDNYSVVTNDHTMVAFPKKRAGLISFKREVGELSTIPLERDTFKRSIPEKYKSVHKNNLEEIEKMIERFNSTKAIRNDRVEFGANFENFIETYFSKQASRNLDKKCRNEFLKKYERQQDRNGNVIGDQFKFQNLTDDQRKDLIKLRIKLFSEKLGFLRDVAEAKIRKDSKQHGVTYLEKYGILGNKTRFRNGSKKFTTVKSVVSKSGIDMSKTKNYKNKLSKKNNQTQNREEESKARLIELSSMRDKFDKFIRDYKGNGRQFAIEFEQNFPEIAEKLYKQKTNNILSFRSQNLASSPISVQEHEIEKQFDEEFRKANYRLRYASFFIPTSASNCTSFLGKSLTNAKTQTEKHLDLVRVKEYEKDLKNVALKEDLISYENIFKGLNRSIQKEFSEYIDKENKTFGKKGEKTKKKELKDFISSRISRLKATVHKNKFFSLGTDKLQKLSGVMIDRSEKIMSKEVKNVYEALGHEQGEKYKYLLQSVKEFTTKFNNEKVLIDKLNEKLEGLSNKPYSIENSNQIQKVLDEINSRNKKMAIIKTSLDNAVQRKNAFENNFATSQIDKSMKSSVTKAVVFNTSKSVFDKYAFPALDAFGEKYYIEKDSLEGKQVEKTVASFIMNFKNQVQNMKISFENSEVVELRDYVLKLTDKLEDDFGSILRDVKKTQKLFLALIEELKKSKNNKLQIEVEKYVQRLVKIESEFIKKLKSMNIEIGDVTLAKNKK